MRIREALALAGRQFAEQRMADPLLQAEVLLRHALDMERAELFAAAEETLDTLLEDQFDRLVARRRKGEPLAYIVGHREFYGLDLFVNPDVLIPRQETELLVDEVLNFAKSRPGEELHIADVGTGSGAIAISVARTLPNATLYATDVSPAALAVADINRRRHGVPDRVHLLQGDLLEALHGPVDAIVSNPPYVRTAEIRTLATEVGREPNVALDGGADGLEVTGRLLSEAPRYLRPDGRIVIEIAPEQLASVSQIALEAMPTSSVTFSRDLLGLPRAVLVEASSAESPVRSRSFTAVVESGSL